MASFIVYGDSSGQVTVKAPAVAGTNTITFPAETGTLYTSASTSYLNGQIAWNTTVQTTGFTAVAYGGYFCNTTSAAFTVTLPASPTRGQFVVIVDYAGTAATNPITINPNGANINGSATSQVLNTNRQGVTFTYIDSTQGWLSTSNVYKTGSPFAPQVSVSYLSVAGGGGGGSFGGGGGGAGGYLAGTASLVVGQVYTITVGSGGAAGDGGPAIKTSGTNGTNSIISGTALTTITSIGGGGGSAATPSVGNNGGSGGGAGNQSTAHGSGTPGQGNAGGDGISSNPYGGGGGGGAGAIGANALTTVPGSGGNGGTGSASSITGTPATYAGGGGGGCYGTLPYGSPLSTGGTGGSGGGSAGSITPVNSNTATVNTGGGGGGSGVGPANNGGLASNGASGVVILSVPTANYTGTVTGTYTATPSGSNTIIKYTGSGTYTA